MTPAPPPVIKLLLDFLPASLFIAVFGLATQRPDLAADLVNPHGASWVGIGPIAPESAPLWLAAVSALCTTVVQMLWAGLRRQPVDAMPVVNAVLISVVGGASLWFEPEAFQRWKPSVLCWTLGLAIWLAQLLAGRNLLRTLLQSRLALPARTWHGLNFTWVAFFGGLGLVYLWAAHSLGAAAWRVFEPFAGLGLAGLFMLGQAGYLGMNLRQGPTREHPQ